MEICWITEAGIKTLPADAVPDVVSRADGVVWVDLEHTDEAGMALLTDLVNVQPHDLEDCHTRSPVPKLHAYADHHFSAINGLARGADGRLYFLPVKTFLQPNLVFTVLGPRSAALADETAHQPLTAIRRQVDAQTLTPRSGFEIILALRFEMLRAYEELVSVAATRVAQLEQSVMKLEPVKAEGLLGDLFGLRHDLQMIRTNAAQTLEMYAHHADRLDSQDSLMRLDLRRLNDLRQGFNLLRNTTDLEREYLQEVLDLFQTRVSTELNRFVRKITAFGTIGIGWTIIAGIYGMNFTHMPELGWQYGYPAAIGLMVVVGAALALMFRRRGWL
jgi:magnesium transporter